jgi:hypothetical protein
MGEQYLQMNTGMKPLNSEKFAENDFLNRDWQFGLVLHKRRTDQLAAAVVLSF